MTGLHLCNRLGLSRTLINPSGRQLRRPGNTHFHIGRIRQVNDVRYLTMSFRPIWLAAGALCQMTFLWTDNATIAGRKLSEAGKTVSLVKALLGHPITGNTLNRPRK